MTNLDTIRELLKADAERASYVWKKQDDGSLGYCPECYKSGAQSRGEIILGLVAAINVAHELFVKIHEHDDVEGLEGTMTIVGKAIENLHQKLGEK